MQELPNEEQNRQKDYIVAKSPMLRFFFDPLIESDKEEWLGVVAKYYLSQENKVTEAKGKEALDMGFDIATGKKPDAFPPGATPDQQRKLFNVLALVGYEIGDGEETMTMLDDIYVRLATYGLVTYGKESAQFVFYALSVGNSLNTSPKKEEDVPKVFTDFFADKPWFKSTIPEGKSGRTREQIPEESPILKALVDPVIHVSLDRWQERFDSVLDGRRGAILKAMGEKVNDEELNSVYDGINLNSVFKPEIDEVSQIKLIVIYSMIGFEVGNRDDLSFFSEEFIYPLVALGAVYDNKAARNCFREAAMCGVAWRQVSLENEVPESIREALRQILTKNDGA